MPVRKKSGPAIEAWKPARKAEATSVADAAQPASKGAGQGERMFMSIAAGARQAPLRIAPVMQGLGELGGWPTRIAIAGPLARKSG